METYNEIPNQPKTAYETPKLYEFLSALSQSERHVLRTDASEKYDELGVLIDAIDAIITQDPNQYEIDLEVENGEV